MPRSTTAAELSLLQSAAFNYAVRVLIKDTESVWRNLSGNRGYADVAGVLTDGGASTLGLDWVKGYDIDLDIDQPVSQLTVRLRRDYDAASVYSLSPLRTDSLVNRKADTVTFQAIVDMGLSIRLEVAATQVGINPNQPLEVDGGFESGSLSPNWIAQSSWLIDGTGNGRAGSTYSARRSANAALTAVIQAFFIPVGVGDRLYVEGYLKGLSSADGSARVAIFWYDSGAGFLSSSDGNTVASDGAYHVSSVLGTAPASAAFGRAVFSVVSQTTGFWYADDIACRWASWKRLFEGVIDSVDFDHDPMTVTARDLGGFLVDRWALDSRPTDETLSGGVAVQTLIQTYLDLLLGGAAPTLYTPVSPGINIKTFNNDVEPVMDIVRRLSDYVGFDLRYKWDDGTGAYRLTLYDPDRGKTTPDATIAKDQYIDVTKLALDRTRVRNEIVIKYGPANRRDSITATDATSQTRYGQRTLVIQETDDSPIDILSEAQAFGAIVLSDLKDPKADQTITMLSYWPVELHDLIRFTANSKHYNANQDWAVVHIRHTGDVADDGTAEHRTTIDVRGKPALQSTGWINRLPPRVRDKPSLALALHGADVTGVRESSKVVYGFGEGAGTTSVDQVGRSSLILQSSAGWTTALGGGSIYDFDGSSSRDAKATHATAYDIGGGADFTVDLVFRYDGDLAQAQYLLNHENDYRLAIDTSGQLVYRVRDHWADNTVSAIDFSAASFNPGTFLHVKFKYAQGSSLASIYINGELRATHTATGSSSGSAISDDLHVGSFAGQTNDGVLNGAMSYLRISSGLQDDFPKLAIPRRNRCRATKTSTQSITSNTETTLTFDSEAFDSNALHDNSTNNSRITIPAGGNIGIYVITAQTAWAADSTGLRRITIRKNGSTELAYSVIPGTDISEQNISAIDDAPVVGDYYELRVKQTTAGNLNASDTCWLSATQIL